MVVLAELEKVLHEEVKLPKQPPFEDGKVATRIIDVVASKFEE